MAGILAAADFQKFTGLPHHSHWFASPTCSPRNRVYATQNQPAVKMSMVTATTWVSQGFAARYPAKYDFNEDEYDRISELARLQLDDAKEDLAAAEKGRDDDRQEELGPGVKIPAAFKKRSNESAVKCTYTLMIH